MNFRSSGSGARIDTGGLVTEKLHEVLLGFAMRVDFLARKLEAAPRGPAPVEVMRERPVQRHQPAPGTNVVAEGPLDVAGVSHRLPLLGQREFQFPPVELIPLVLVQVQEQERLVPLSIARTRP